MPTTNERDNTSTARLLKSIRRAPKSVLQDALVGLLEHPFEAGAKRFLELFFQGYEEEAERWRRYDRAKR